MFFDVNATKLNYNHAVRYLSSAIKDIKYTTVYIVHRFKIPKILNVITCQQRH